MKLALALLLALSAVPAELAGREDARLVELTPGPQARWRLLTCTKTAQTLLFQPGERILSVTVSDPASYRTGISGSGDSLVLVPSGTIDVAAMTVETSAARYEFDLVPSGAQEAPQVVRVARSLAAQELPPVGGSAPSDTPPPVLVDTGQYRLKGDAIVRPSLIADDGGKTYILWLEDQSMPAVFGIGPSGEEEMVEGHMRDGVFTIDRLYDRLVFRIDKMKAEARRLGEGERR